MNRPPFSKQWEISTLHPYEVEKSHSRDNSSDDESLDTSSRKICSCRIRPDSSMSTTRVDLDGSATSSTPSRKQRKISEKMYERVDGSSEI